MPSSSEPLPDAELVVLKALWAEPHLSARELAESIYGNASTTSIGTVQKLLQRLERKKCVRRDRSQYIHRFSAAITQEEIAGAHLDWLAQRVSNGSFAPFLTHLVQGQKLSDEEKQDIRRLLEE